VHEVGQLLRSYNNVGNASVLRGCDAMSIGIWLQILYVGKASCLNFQCLGNLLVTTSREGLIHQKSLMFRIMALIGSHVDDGWNKTK